MELDRSPVREAMKAPPFSVHLFLHKHKVSVKYLGATKYRWSDQSCWRGGPGKSKLSRRWEGGGRCSLTSSYTSNSFQGSHWRGWYTSLTMFQMRRGLFVSLLLNDFFHVFSTSRIIRRRFLLRCGLWADGKISTASRSFAVQLPSAKIPLRPSDKKAAALFTQY